MNLPFVFALRLFLPDPIGKVVLAADGRAELAPAVGRSVQKMREPTPWLACSRERKRRKQNDKCQNSGGNAERDVINPQFENERQKVSRRRRNENEFPIALINSAPFDFVINIRSDGTRFHRFGNLEIGVNRDSLPLRNGVNDGDDCSEGERAKPADGVIRPLLTEHLVPNRQSYP